MRFTEFQYQEMLTRLDRKKCEASVAAGEVPGFPRATKEIGKGGLQDQIMQWCDAQWPKWVYDFPRTDLRSTLPLGRHDATIWGPHPKCFVIESKATGRKRTLDQLIWAARMGALGWKVKLIYSQEEFIAYVTKPTPATH